MRVPGGHAARAVALGPLFAGAAYLAREAGVPIVPVGIGGSEEIIRAAAAGSRGSRRVVRGRRRADHVPSATDGTSSGRRSPLPTTSCGSSSRSCFDDALRWSAERTGRRRQAEQIGQTRRTRRRCGRRERRRRDPRLLRVATERQRRERGRARDQLAQLARRREVLVLVGDVTGSTPSTGARCAITASTRSSGALAPAVTPTTAASPSTARSSSSGPSTRSTSGQPASRATLAEGERVRRVRAPDHDDRVGPRRDRAERRLPVRGREAEVVARRGPQLGELATRARSAMPCQSWSASVVWASIATFAGRRPRRGRVDVVLVLDQPDRLGRDGEGADRLVVAGVADVEDRVALPGPDLGLVVDLGDERAHRVHDEAALGAGRGDHLGRRAVGRQHERRRRREPRRCRRRRRRRAPEPVDDEPVVDDLVVAVHRRLEDAHHPGQRLDRHLDAGAEPPRFGEQHLLRPASTAQGYSAGDSGRPRRLTLMPCPHESLPSRPDPRPTQAGLLAGDEIGRQR